MDEQLKDLVSTMTYPTEHPGDSFREVAHELSKLAINTYEGKLLTSSLLMVAAIAQFASDLDWADKP